MYYFWSTVFLSFLGGLTASAVTESVLKERIIIFGSFIGFELSYNQGIAFGIKLGVLQPFLIAFALILIVWVAIQSAQSRWHQIGFGLIVGGGLANVVDRFLDGHVTDFIQIGTFPVFNIADSCITIGVAILFIDMILLASKRKERS